MALDGQRQFVGRDAGPIIGHLDQGPARRGNFHASRIFAPASSAFSSSSFTTEAGRSTTSPAAICEATSGGRTRMGMPLLYPYNSAMRFTTFFFDLDETLYPSSSGLWVAIRERINALHASNAWAFPRTRLQLLREKYFPRIRDHAARPAGQPPVDMDEYLAFVHDVPLGSLSPSGPGTSCALERIRARKFIFTNADSAHANRVMKAVGLEGLCDGIIDVHAIAPYCKPMPEAFQLALKAAGDPVAHLRPAG